MTISEKNLETDLRTLDRSTLTGLVRRAKGCATVELTNWHVQTMKPGLGPATGGVYRLAGTAWDRVALLSCFLQRGQSVSELQRLLRQSVPGGVPRLECELVEGFAGEAYSIEIEATAVR